MSADYTSRPTESALEHSDSRLGLAHLTVVPTNFDPDAPGGRRD